MSFSPAMLLAHLANLGATVSTHGDRLRIEAADELPQGLLDELRERKAELLPLARLLGLSLQKFAQEGQPLEIRVPWLQVTLWFVPTETDAEHLSLEGVSRGRIWTTRELIDFLPSGAGLRPDQMRAVALAKFEFGGDVIEVRPR